MRSVNILFQGDSLTDSCRAKNITEPNRGLGDGYVGLIAARLGCDRPDLHFFNRGVSGNRIAEIYARWIEDTLNMEYDVLSILCGVNDVGFQLRLNRGADIDTFEWIYDRMLQEALKKRPAGRIVLCEPFLFRIKDPSNQNDIYENWDLWYGKITQEAEVVDFLAEKYHAVLVRSRTLFENVCRRLPPEHLSVDGIHLRPAGCWLLAQEWIRCAGSLVDG